MKPTLVDNCEQYTYQTHNCNKCGRGLPDVCLDYEEMKRKAEAYEQNIQTNSRKDILHEQSDIPRSDKATDVSGSTLSMDSEQTQEATKRRGRPRKVTK